MSDRVRIVKILGNPAKRKKKMRATKARRRKVRKDDRGPRVRAAHARAARPSGARFLVEGSRSGGRLDYLTSGGSWRHRSKARRFRTAGEATKAMRDAAPKAEKLGFSRLQVVVA